MSLCRHVSRFLGVGCARSATAAIGGLGVIAFACFTATPAHADPNCGMWITPDGRWEFDYRRCPEGAPDPGGYQDKWVAIAVSESTVKVGLAWQADTEQEAERVALAYCRKYASDCTIKLSRLNMCLAVATSMPDLTWGVDFDRNGKKAQAKALAQCQNAKGRACKIVGDPCSHDDY